MKSWVTFVSCSLKCQSLLHMAMFRHKQKTALKYSKTLTDHFNVSINLLLVNNKCILRQKCSTSA